MEKQEADSTNQQANESSADNESHAAPVEQPAGEPSSSDGINSGSQTPQGQPEVGAQTQPENPPGQTINTASAQPDYGQPVMGQPYVQAGYAQPQPVYVQQPTPEQVAASQAAATQRYGQVIHSVEQFVSGEATVADVVKTLYTTTAQDTQLWKGVLVGAAAAVLLTSEPVRDVMGKTMGGLFPGLKSKAESNPQQKTTTNKEN
jgi:hypothetical protein